MGKRLEFPWRYKGARDYLHGTDLFDLACAALAGEGFEDLTHLDLTLHQLAREGLRGDLLGAAEPAAPGATAVLRFQSQGERMALRFYANGQAVERRDPYPEEEIAAAGVLQDRRISLSKTIPFSNIEKVVAMNKALLQALFPEAPGKWLFTSLKLRSSFYSRSLAVLELEFESHLNLALTRTRIRADGADLGHIFFSLGRP